MISSNQRLRIKNRKQRRRKKEKRNFCRKPDLPIIKEEQPVAEKLKNSWWFMLGF